MKRYEVNRTATLTREGEKATIRVKIAHLAVGNQCGIVAGNGLEEAQKKEAMPLPKWNAAFFSKTSFTSKWGKRRMNEVS